MNMKKLIGMVVVFVLLAGIALVQRKDDTPRQQESNGQAGILPSGLDLNAVSQLDVTQGSNNVELVKKDGVWTVASLYGYPADFSRLADALRAMAEVKAGSPLRAANVQASEFGLDDTAKQITLKTGDGRAAAAVTVGARREASAQVGWANQFFVRKNQESAVYLVDYDFQPFSEKPEEWISTELLRVSSGDVVSVQAGEVLLKLDGADWTLAGLDQAAEELQTSEASRMRSALQYLNCTTVADPAKTDAELGMETPVVFVAQTQDGLTYTVKLGAKTGDGQFMRIAVDYVRAEQSEEGDDRADKAAKLNARLSPWTYVIGTYAAEAMQLTRDKLVKPKTDEPAAEETDSEVSE